MTDSSPLLIALSGLPGTGKTTVARELARACGAMHLRIDTLEAALERSALRIRSPEDAGYRAAYGVAADNLFGTNVVIADCVNPIALTRDAWAEVASAAAARLLEVELVCADEAEHRRRVEARRSDIDGLVVPTWNEVREHRYDPWNRARLLVDTASTDPAAAVREISERIELMKGKRAAP